jgi:hypothetical protein
MIVVDGDARLYAVHIAVQHVGAQNCAHMHSSSPALQLLARLLVASGGFVMRRSLDITRHSPKGLQDHCYGGSFGTRTLRPGLGRRRKWQPIRTVHNSQSAGYCLYSLESLASLPPIILARSRGRREGKLGPHYPSVGPSPAGREAHRLHPLDRCAVLAGRDSPSRARHRRRRLRHCSG